jgi:putative DNA primase/helicase
MAKLFRGYLLSNGKTPLSSVKDKSNWLDTPPEGDYLGILREDIVQIDVDSEDDAEIVLRVVRDLKLRCDILKTSRGMHFYFLDDGWIKSQSVGVFSAMGIKVDVGLGSKDRVVPLRITRDVTTKRIVDGEQVDVTSQQTIEREWLQTYSELDELPVFLRPISKFDPDLKHTKTRNQTLFNYILELQKYGLSREEVRKIIRVANKYVLYEPLTDKEIDTITRDEAFSEEIFFSEKGAFLHDRFGNYMLANSNIMKIDNQVCIYTMDNVYSNDPEEFERVMLSKIPSLKESQRKEVYKYIVLKTTKKGEYASPKYIGLKNSILDIETMDELPYSPRLIINNRVDYNYNPYAYHEIMDKTLNKVSCNDPEIRMLLEEMIGYSLYRKNNMQVAFILTGEGSNGKSTILNLIKKLLGKQNYTSLDIRELEDTFKPAELYNKLANIGDDISNKYLEGSSVFKKVVTGESFVAQRKYAQPFELESYATQIFCANQLPNVNDRTDGFSRRLIIIPFNAKFSSKDADYDPFIEDKLMQPEAMEYLLKISIDGLKRVLSSKQFTKSSKADLEKEAYMLENNNVLQWFYDADPKIENESTSDVYQQYQMWCGRNGYKALSKSNLGREIKKQYGYSSKPMSVDGNVVRVYIKESD